MSLGQLTEKGIVMIKAPVLCPDSDSSLFSFMRGGSKNQHSKMGEIAA
jgi:hypothetical protein